MKFDCKECGAEKSTGLVKVAKHGVILKVLGALAYLIALISFLVIGFYSLVGWGAVMLGFGGFAKVLAAIIGVLSGLAASALPIFVGNELTGSKYQYECQKCSAIFDRSQYVKSSKNIKKE
jgi:hypothetical protein